MNTTRFILPAGLLGAIALLLLSGCVAAPKRVVVVDQQAHKIRPGYVVVSHRTRGKSCYRHQKHWHCR